jgi:hypothetical protein
MSQVTIYLESETLELACAQIAPHFGGTSTLCATAKRMTAWILCSTQRNAMLTLGKMPRVHRLTNHP